MFVQEKVLRSAPKVEHLYLATTVDVWKKPQVVKHKQRIFWNIRWNGEKLLLSSRQPTSDVAKNMLSNSRYLYTYIYLLIFSGWSGVNALRPALLSLSFSSSRQAPVSHCLSWLFSAVFPFLPSCWMILRLSWLFVLYLFLVLCPWCLKVFVKPRQRPGLTWSGLLWDVQFYFFATHLLSFPY